MHSPSSTARIPIPWVQERPGTARHAGPADLWHGPARKIMARKILARKNNGTAWPGNFLQALSFWARCRRRFFFSAKKAPIFLQALSFWVRCRRRLVFFGKKGPHISGHGSTRSGHGSSGHGTEIFGTARIIRARHGNIWHGTDPPDLGTARHGTCLL